MNNRLGCKKQALYYDLPLDRHIAHPDLWTPHEQENRRGVATHSGH